MLARLYLVIFILLLAACGGGGGGGGGGGSGNPPVTAPSNLSYASPQTFASGQAIAAISPTVTGTVTGYTVSPSLPAGLSLNAATGVISGTPTTASPAATYTVTAANSAGSTTANLSITVTSGVGTTLLDLGHARPVFKVRYDADRVLSVDESGHWVLWNASSTEQVASGNTRCDATDCASEMDLAGSSLLRRTAAGFEVRSSVTGEILSNVTSTAAWLKLAVDGSYIVGGGTANITAWSPTGTVLFTRAGNYSSARAFAAAGEIRIANGPVGGNLIETITASTGAASNGAAFNGQFHSWFLDGARFLTNAGNTIWVYSAQSVQQDFRSLDSIDQLVGQGNYFWRRWANVRLQIYTVGASAAPVGDFSVPNVDQIIPSRDTIGIRSLTGGPFRVIDLSGATPTETSPPLPIRFVVSYAAGANGERLVGNLYGVVIESTPPALPKYFAHGEVRSIAASSARIAVATADGRTQIFDAQTLALETTMNLRSNRLAMSADGTVLAATSRSDDTTDRFDDSLFVFSLPSTAEIQHRTFDPLSDLLEIALAPSAGVLSSIYQATGTKREVAPLGGGPLIYSDTVFQSGVSYTESPVPLRLSPDGTAIAAPDRGPNPNTGTNLIINGALTSATVGWPAGWIDDSRLLVHQYSLSNMGDVVYSSSVIVNRAGQTQLSLTLADIREFQTVDANRIYDPATNRMYSLVTGSVVWSSAAESTGVGAVAGDHIVFASGPTVRMETY